MVPTSSASGLTHLDDEGLAERTAAGDRAALEVLLGRHQGWVFNLALYQLQSRPDAEDATQEILLKALTGLSTFRRASTFRTWLRRIAVNHLLDRRRSGPEAAVKSFECYGSALDATPEDEPGAWGDPQRALLVEEARHACVLGMLLCLDRSQRLVFLLGELLEVGDAEGAELLELTRENFRQRLSRAREQLRSFMRGRCGLVDPAGPCHCARKTAAFVRAGIVDPTRLQFASHALQAARSASAATLEALTRLQGRDHLELRSLYPRFSAPDLARTLSRLLEGQTAMGASSPAGEGEHHGS
jgi:RNA polymerase sigma factor (sigma-70 family)